MEIAENKSDGLLIEADDLVNILNPEPNKKALPHDINGNSNG